jgi:hypothetical protein
MEAKDAGSEIHPACNEMLPRNDEFDVFPPSTAKVK